MDHSETCVGKRDQPRVPRGFWLTGKEHHLPACEHSLKKHLCLVTLRPATNIDKLLGKRRSFGDLTVWFEYS